MAARIMAAALALLWAPALCAEVKHARAQGFTIENVRVVATDPDTAWAALVDDVDRWWPKDHTLDRSGRSDADNEVKRS